MSIIPASIKSKFLSSKCDELNITKDSSVSELISAFKDKVNASFCTFSGSSSLVQVVINKVDPDKRSKVIMER